MKNQKFIFWGIGHNANNLYALIDSSDIAFAVDSNADLQGKKWNELDVCSFQKCLDKIRGKEAEYTFLVTPTEHQEIFGLLREYGLPNYITINDFLKRYMMRNYMNGNCAGNYSLERKLEILKNAKHPCYSVHVQSVFHIAEIVCGHPMDVPGDWFLPEKTDLFLFHGIMPNLQNVCRLREAEQRGIPFFFVEDGYLSSIVPFDAPCDEIFRRRHAMVLGKDNIPINAYAPSDLEYILNSDFTLSLAQIERTRAVIGKIRKHYLSKYNHQPIRKIAFGNREKMKVLVIDQVYGDKSIEYGNADENTFRAMLHAAMDENPDADIFIKAHPVKSKGHFQSAKKYENVFILYEDINPICLLESMDRVYVCTSQMGFEAVLCGKEVHVFGMPFYGGWGITRDRQRCERRKKKRTVEDIFYAAYIIGTIYVSYKIHGICEIEQTIDELIELRDRYWAQMEQ